MEEVGLPELASEQIEQLCSIAEAAAREHVLKKVPSKKIEALNISAEAEGLRPLRLTIDVDIVLSPTMKGYDVQELADQAVKRAFASAGKHLRELTCHSRK